MNPSTDIIKFKLDRKNNWIFSHYRNRCYCCNKFFIKEKFDTLCKKCIKFNFDLRIDQHGNILEFLIFRNGKHVWYPRIDQEINNDYLCICDVCNLEVKYKELLTRSRIFRMIEFDIIQQFYI